MIRLRCWFSLKSTAALVRQKARAAAFVGTEIIFAAQRLVKRRCARRLVLTRALEALSLVWERLATRAKRASRRGIAALKPLTGLAQQAERGKLNA